MKQTVLVHLNIEVDAETIQGAYDAADDYLIMAGISPEDVADIEVIG